MTNSTWHKKSSQIILGLIVGIIVFSFVLSGIDNMAGWSVGRTQVATVNGNPIEYRDFERALEQQARYFSQMMGGKNLTNKELEQFGIKKRVLEGLIQRKLLQNLGDDLGITPSTKEVSGEIKNFPYFLTNNNFDVTKYRMVLESNRLTPQIFEENFKKDLIIQNIEETISKAKVSQKFSAEVSSFKEQRQSATLLKVNKSDLQAKIVISSNKIKEFISNPDNNSKMESLFSRRKPQWDRPEQVKARHILFSASDDKSSLEAEKKAKDLLGKLNASNFSKLADQYTEDPSGKGKGGSLGVFGRGRMVPEFEQAVFNMKVGTITGPIKTQFGQHLILLEEKIPAIDAKLEDYQEKLAQEILQEEDKEALESLKASLKNQVSILMAKGDKKSLEKLSKEYSGQLFFQEEVNLWDGKVGSIKLEDEQLEKVFASSNENFHLFENAASLTLVHISPSKSDKAAEISKNERESLQFQLSRTLREKAISRMMETSKIYQNPDLI